MEETRELTLYTRALGHTHYADNPRVLISQLQPSSHLHAARIGNSVSVSVYLSCVTLLYIRECARRQKVRKVREERLYAVVAQLCALSRHCRSSSLSSSRSPLLRLYPSRSKREKETEKDDGCKRKRERESAAGGKYKFQIGAQRESALRELLLQASPPLRRFLPEFRWLNFISN